jgi:hypothetical protein
MREREREREREIVCVFKYIEQYSWNLVLLYLNKALDNTVYQIFLPFSFGASAVDGTCEEPNLSPSRQDFPDHSLNIKIKMYTIVILSISCQGLQFS